MPTRNICWNRGPLGSIRVLAISESNFEIDSIFHYRESTTLQYPMYITMRHQVLKSVTYYPLHTDSPWTSVHNLTIQCYHLSRLPPKSLTYFSPKEHMLNSTKGTTMTTDFMITCPLDHPMGHVVSIPWDIMVPLLRKPIATILYQLWPNP